MILFPDLSKTIKSSIPSKFRSISEICAELIPPIKGELKRSPSSYILRLVSLFNIICADTLY